MNHKKNLTSVLLIIIVYFSLLFSVHAAVLTEDTEVLYLDNGDTCQLDTDTLLQDSVQYTSSDPETATVSKTGLITGIDTGIATIRIEDQQTSIEIEVRVNYGLVVQDQFYVSRLRDDYPNLSDRAYANFRAVNTTGMGKGKLYRSSSPLNPKLNRNNEVDKACKKVGIRTVLNLGDSKKQMRKYDSYSGSYVSKQDICCLDMETDFFTKDFQRKLKKGLRYIINHKPPYLIHCTYGRDRTGFVTGILECLMGASYEEIRIDYLRSYKNYNGLTYGDERAEDLFHYLLEKDLCEAFKTESLQEVNMSRKARIYLMEIGLTEKEVKNLKKRLR